MVKCPKCGGEIKYIPTGYAVSASGVVIVDPDYTELINDNGRVVKGHLRHRCPETKCPMSERGEKMVRLMKQRLKKALIFFVCAGLVFFASAVVNSVVFAETSAAKIESNAEYFSGGSGMGAVEITTASLNSLHGAVNITLTFLLWLFIILSLYNGAYSVYQYFLSKESKKNEK